MYYRKKSVLSKTCLGHDIISNKKGSNEKLNKKMSVKASSSLVMTPFFTPSPFKRKRTWMFILFLGIISSTFNLVPNLVFADVSVVRSDNNNKHRDVRPTSWDPLTSPSADPKSFVPPSTTPGSFLHELSTPPLTTPSNYRTWKNTNRRSSKKGVNVGDDFHVGTNEVNNRVDVDWENDVIAFEDEDEDAEIGDDENVFYYYDDGGETDSYDGKSSMEGIHDVDHEEDEDIVVFDGDIYPKVISMTFLGSKFLNVVLLFVS